LESEGGEENPHEAHPHHQRESEWLEPPLVWSFGIPPHEGRGINAVEEVSHQAHVCDLSTCNHIAIT
jgi:hypothetical protein